MKKILVIIGTRPEAIKMFPVVHALRDDPQFDCVVCTTGQHREMVDDVLDFAGVVPDYRLDAMRAGQSLDELTARLMMQIGPVIDKVQPDWVVVQGDTTSAFCGGLAAYYRRIRVCHVEAGLRTGDIHQPWPEEANRKMIATFATLHCAPTEGAAENLRREGVAEDRIHVTGNTVIDALKWTHEALRETGYSSTLVDDFAKRFEDKKLVVVTCHRRENHGQGVERVAKAIKLMAHFHQVAFVVSLHRHPCAREAFMLHLSELPNVALVEHLSYPAFVDLLNSAALVLTDSGGIQEEVGWLGKPLLLLRETTERQEVLSEGLGQIVGTEITNIIEKVCEILDGLTAFSRKEVIGSGDTRLKIAELLVF